jgi:hypothetical protein
MFELKNITRVNNVSLLNEREREKEREREGEGKRSEREIKNLSFRNLLKR